jgi:hypothetical protein
MYKSRTFRNDETDKTDSNWKRPLTIADCSALTTVAFLRVLLQLQIFSVQMQHRTEQWHP